MIENFYDVLTYFMFIINMKNHLLFLIAHDNDSILIYNEVELKIN